jgi:alginate O-acetyltransferase complex protein AlgI
MNGAILRMLVLIAVTFVTMKIVVVAVTGTRLTVRQWVAFAGWFGMRPAVFTRRGKREQTPLVRGLIAIAAGIALLLIARNVQSPGMVFVLALPALSLILHFGIVDVTTALYRRAGWPVNEPFRNPLASRSLNEFWSRRWNVGFSEMIAVTVHRPVRRVAGEPAGLFAAFLASGLLHEIAISAPVNAGYGLPTLYFLLHGALVAIERRHPQVASRAWTLFWLAAPLPILFHPWFVRGIVWPLLGR